MAGIWLNPLAMLHPAERLAVGHDVNDIMDGGRLAGCYLGLRATHQQGCAKCHGSKSELVFHSIDPSVSRDGPSGPVRACQQVPIS